MFNQEMFKSGINLGLERIYKLLEFLDNPQDKLKVIHVAGTNGKGSVTAFLSSILASNDITVGVFTSPFLERFSERMRIIDGITGINKYQNDDSYGEISEAELKKYVNIIKNISDKLVKEGMEKPTEFEFITAVALLWFSNRNVDVVILETGLGGRLDSTNVCDKPLCTLITAMGMDHSAILGNSIEQITIEKAGIIKNGVKAFFIDPADTILLSDEQQNDVKNILISKAEEKNAPYEFVSVANSMKSIKYISYKQMMFEFEGQKYMSNLLGSHQVQNAALAIKCAEYLGIDLNIIQEGINRANWKGRCEIIRKTPFVLIDGAHNPQGMESLALTLASLEIVNGAVRLVLGAMADKDTMSMLSIIIKKFPGIVEYNITRVNNPRSLGARELYDRIDSCYEGLGMSFSNIDVRCNLYNDAKIAVKEAYKRTMEDNTPLLIIGSLYLAGEVRGELINLINGGENV